MKTHRGTKDTSWPNTESNPVTLDNKSNTLPAELNRPTIILHKKFILVFQLKNTEIIGYPGKIFR